MFNAQVASAWPPHFALDIIPTFSVLSAEPSISWSDYEYFDFLGSRINGWIVLGTIIINSVISIIIMHLELLVIWLTVF